MSFLEIVKAHVERKYGVEGTTSRVSQSMAALLASKAQNARKRQQKADQKKQKADAAKLSRG